MKAKVSKVFVEFSGSLRVNYALHPSKSGLINKHTVKHTVGLMQTNKQTNKQTNMPYLGCPIPVQVRTNEQTYRET